MANLGDNMKIFKSKKSDIGDIGVIAKLPFWGMFVVLLGVMMIILIKLGNVSVTEASEIPEDLEEQFILASRFYNSPDCFAYKDEVDRVHTKVIDYRKFTKPNLDTCYPSSSTNYAFQLSLEPPTPPGGIGPPVFPPLVLETSNWIQGKFEKIEALQDVNVIYSRGGINFDNYNGKLRIKIQDVQ